MSMLAFPPHILRGKFLYHLLTLLTTIAQVYFYEFFSLIVGGGDFLGKEFQHSFGFIICGCWRI